MASTKVENISGGLAAGSVVTWAVILLIAFVSYRESDVGQLQRLIGNLGGGPLFGFEGFRDNVFGGLIAVLIIGSWFGLGALVSGFIPTKPSERHSHILEVAISTAIGAAIWSLTWFFL